MDINETAKRPRDSEGVPGGTLAVDSVGEKSGTVAAPTRPSFIDLSRFDISKAQVGEMTVRVYKVPAYWGSARNFAYDVAWMGKVLWTEYAADAETARDVVEAAGVDRADQLTEVVWRVGGLLVGGLDRPCGSVRDRAAPVIWTALPDQPEEPRA